MSVRAYKVYSLEWEESPTFNTWRDKFIMEYLIYTGEASEGSGLIEVYRGDVEDIRDNFEKYWKEYTEEYNLTNELKEDYREKVENIINDFGNEDYIKYICF